MDDAHDADGTRKDLVIDRVREPVQQKPPQASANDGKAIGRVRDIRECAVDGVQELTGSVRGAGAIPLERFVDLRTRADAHDERGHLAEPGAELVAKRGPRNARLGIRVGLGFAAIELGGEGGGQRGGGGGVQTIPEATDERDALLGRQGFEDLGLVDHENRMANLLDLRNA